MHGDAHYHDVGGKLNNEQSALLFRLLFRKIEHMRIFRVDFFYDFMKRFSSLIRYYRGILEWFCLGNITTQKESHVESSLRERDRIVS